MTRNRMVNMFFRGKRRLREEFRGLKSLMKKKRTQRALRASYYVVEAVRIVYNPWHLLDLFVFPHFKKSLTNI